MNTAIDFYSRGKEKEAEAKDYSTSYWYPRGRFICPECGEEVYLSRSKYKNFFKHYKRTAQTPECERRVDSGSNESIYERIGLPLFLKEDSVGIFKLFIGFQAITAAELERAERERCEVWVNRKLKYRINRERFSCKHSFWMPIDFAPYDEYYTISYTGSQFSISVFENNWGRYAEAFMGSGALFKAEGGSNRKLHKGDSIATDTNYFWAVRREKGMCGLRGMQHTFCGTLELSNCTYSIYRVVFQSDISDSDFEALSHYLLKELKVHLLEKAAELVPIWPPLIRQGDRFEVPDSIQTVYGAVESGNTFPFIYGYYESNPIPSYFTAGEGSVVSLPIRQKHQYFTVDRKNVSTGMIIEKVEKGEWAIDGCSQSRSLSVNGESLDFPGEITHSKGNLAFNVIPGADIVVKRKSTIECFRKQTECLVRNLTPFDSVYIFNEAEFLFFVRGERIGVFSEERINTEELERMLLKYENTQKVFIPLEIRKRLLAHYHKNHFINKILLEGKMPLALLRHMERHKDV